MMRWFFIFFLIWPLQSVAQGVATLVADSVEITADQRLIATGNIEALYDGTRLSARQIIYDRRSDRLIISGPIFIQGDDGSLITAEQADLDPRLQNGLLRGARLVLDQRLQLAANRIDRVDGRFSQLSRVAVTSCQVCGTERPLWEIRANRVVHDQDARQLYFDNATLHLRGVPIFWLPYMRLPDPTLPRATGFLIPRIRNNDQLGTGIKLPYFIRLGDHRDLTLTPFLSPESATLEARFRQAFLRGDIEINGAVSDDTLTEDIRSYLFAEGQFDLGRDYQLTFNLQTVSDPAYLLDYGYDSSDRLESQIAVTRVRENDLLQTQVTFFESLRDNEIDTALPPIVGRLSYDARVPLTVGGSFDYGISTDTAVRTNPTIGPDARDLTRVGVYGGWTNSFVLPAGVLAQTSIGAKANWFAVNDDPGASDGTQFIPHVAAKLRWPLTRQTASGGADVLEPILALAWSDQYGITPPNEDSTRAAFDLGNLDALSRYPGDDRTETGLRAAAGLSWTRNRASGTTTRLSFGRLFRSEAPTGFTQSSGLAGLHSDWLIGGQITTTGGFSAEVQSILDDTFDVTLATARVQWNRDDLSLAAAYIWQEADAAELRPDIVSEWQLDTTYQVTDAWQISLDTRYDIIAQSPDRAGLGIEWRNECVTVDLSVSRRFTSSTTVNPSTDYGLNVTLNGFSAGQRIGPAAHCSD